jgi:hypothetical protein
MNKAFQYEEEHKEEIFVHYDKEKDADLNLPNVIILVSDNVKLIRNNSVPMLQV